MNSMHDDFYNEVRSLFSFRDRNIYGGNGDGRSTFSKKALSAIAMRVIDEYFSLFAASTIFRHIYFCH